MKRVHFSSKTVCICPWNIIDLHNFVTFSLMTNYLPFGQKNILFLVLVWLAFYSDFWGLASHIYYIRQRKMFLNCKLSICGYKNITDKVFWRCTSKELNENQSNLISDCLFVSGRQLIVESKEGPPYKFLKSERVDFNFISFKRTIN